MGCAQVGASPHPKVLEALASGLPWPPTNTKSLGLNVWQERLFEKRNRVLMYVRQPFLIKSWESDGLALKRLRKKLKPIRARESLETLMLYVHSLERPIN